MIVLVMAISNLVLTRQIYSEETNGTHSHYREPVPLKLCKGYVSFVLNFLELMRHPCVLIVSKQLSSKHSNS